MGCNYFNKVLHEYINKPLHVRTTGSKRQLSAYFIPRTTGISRSLIFFRSVFLFRPSRLAALI